MADQDTSLNNQELIDLTEKTLGPVQKKINQFTLKAAGEGWSAFKRIMATMTEPFFRRGMGMRYYNYSAFVPAVTLWFIAGLWTIPIARYVSVAALLCRWHVLHPLAFIFWHPLFPFMVGVIMAVIQVRVGWLNIVEARRLFLDGSAHHSRSRGAAVWQNEGRAYLMIEAVLLFFHWPMALLFGFGYGLNQMLKAAQDAAIRERYLDAIDQEIENKYLKDSALGNCPPETTFLYHQIDPNIKPAIREKMAAALVGEPVSGVGKPPQKKKKSAPPTQNTQTGEPSAAETVETAAVAVDPESEVGKMARTNGGRIATPPGMTQAQFERYWALGLMIKRYFVPGVIVFIVGLAAVFGISHLIHSPKKTRAAAPPPVVRIEDPIRTTLVTPPPTTVTPPVAAKPVTTAPARVEVVPAPVSPASQKIAVEEQPAQNTPVANAAKANAEPTPVAPTATTPQVAETKIIPQISKPVEAPKTELAAAIEALNTFSNYAASTIAAENARIEKIPNSADREKMSTTSLQIKSAVDKMITKQGKYLGNWEPGPDADASVARSTPPMIIARSAVTNALVKLDTQVRQLAMQQ